MIKAIIELPDERDEPRDIAQLAWWLESELPGARVHVYSAASDDEKKPIVELLGRSQLHPSVTSAECAKAAGRLEALARKYPHDHELVGLGITLRFVMDWG